ncbi:unnamed protein product [Gongylonema pulchrum]|uniref:Ribosomal_L18_c domain-containing protein n=1 Tax=Gongylonema pulchrum TaxID=637853 RepID=A0A183E3M1_9BILA|nr:unnamed protein product [Gongylonema pulchrum]
MAITSPTKTNGTCIVFTFPSANRQPLRVPSLLVPLKAPQHSPPIEKFVGPRMLKIRRHKMIKHKRRKRYDRDYFKYQKYHRKKKEKAENLFRERMQKMMDEYRTFDPEQYVKDIIARAKQDVTKDVAPSGRRKYPHWSTVITLEELYGLPPSDYIDKNAGLPGEEDRDKIRQLKKDYEERYRGFLTRTNSTNPVKTNLISDNSQDCVAGDSSDKLLNEVEKAAEGGARHETSGSLEPGDKTGS